MKIKFLVILLVLLFSVSCNLNTRNSERKYDVNFFIDVDESYVDNKSFLAEYIYYEINVSGFDSEGNDFNETYIFNLNEDKRIKLDWNYEYSADILLKFNYDSIDTIVAQDKLENLKLKKRKQNDIVMKLIPDFNKRNFTVDFISNYEKDDVYYKIEYLYQVNVREDLGNYYQRAEFDFTDFLPELKLNNSNLYLGNSEEDTIYIGTYESIGGLAGLMNQCEEIRDLYHSTTDVAVKYYKENGEHLKIKQYNMYYEKEEGGFECIIPLSSSCLISSNVDYFSDVLEFTERNFNITLPYYDFLNQIKFFYLIDIYDSKSGELLDTYGDWIYNPLYEGSDDYESRVLMPASLSGYDFDVHFGLAGQ